MKHYGLTGKTTEHNGRILNQIICTVAIEELDIEVGTIGGYIEKEENLSDSAWVYGVAKVCGDVGIITGL